MAAMAMVMTAAFLAVALNLQVAIRMAVAVPTPVDMTPQLETELDPHQDLSRSGDNGLDEEHLDMEAEIDMDVNAVMDEEVDGAVDPEVTPGLYQGDMAGVGLLGEDAVIRLGIRWDVFPELRWANNTVPYVISNRYLPAELVVIKAAIAILNFLTCIRFIPWDGKVEDYLFISPVKKPSGCWSYVGRQGGRQMLSLQRPTSRGLRCLGTVGKPIHELLHAIGIFHEQSRSDRDEHVTIIKDNIHEKFLRNFRKTSEKNTTYAYDYDYKSVMHYGSYFFSKDRKTATIVPKVSGAPIGQRLMLSSTDCLKVNHLYGCLDQDARSRARYETFCNYLGL